MHGAINYAEKDLGVHAIHVEAEVIAEQIARFNKDLGAAIWRRRSVDDAILEQEMNLQIEVRTKFGELTQAALDRKIRAVNHQDAELKRLRLERRDVLNSISGIELEIDSLKSRLKVKVARMEELAGYFNYLAAVKNAEPPAVQYAEARTPAK